MWTMKTEQFEKWVPEPRRNLAGGSKRSYQTLHRDFGATTQTQVRNHVWAHRESEKWERWEGRDFTRTVLVPVRVRVQRESFHERCTVYESFTIDIKNKKIFSFPKVTPLKSRDGTNDQFFTSKTLIKHVPSSKTWQSMVHRIFKKVKGDTPVRKRGRRKEKGQGEKEKRKEFFIRRFKRITTVLYRVLTFPQKPQNVLT